MDLLFRTKEESNRAQEQAFFNLNPVDRFVVFLNLMEALKYFPFPQPHKQMKTFLKSTSLQKCKTEILKSNYLSGCAKDTMYE